MTTSTLASNPVAVDVRVTDDALVVVLADGREVSVPISWFPRLSHAEPKHRAIWELLGQGHGIHWPELDEDISVENLLQGQPSGEGSRSFARWKEWYQKRRTEPSAPADSGATPVSNQREEPGAAAL